MKWTATGPHWFFGFGEVRNGKAYFLQGKEPLLCPKNFALYLPPHTLVQGDSRAGEVYLDGHLYHGSLPQTVPQSLPATALLFVPETWSLPTKSEKIAEFIAKGTRKMDINRFLKCSYLLERAKKAVDESLAKDPRKKELNIPELAFKLKTNASSLSREFQTHTGLSLKEYYELLQTADTRFAALPEGAPLHADFLGLL